MINLESLKIAISTLEEILLELEKLPSTSRVGGESLDLLEIEFFQKRKKLGEDPFVGFKDHGEAWLGVLQLLRPSGNSQFAKFFSEGFFKDMSSVFGLKNLLGLSLVGQRQLREFSERKGVQSLKASSFFEFSLIMGVASHIVRSESPQKEASALRLLAKALSPLTHCMAGAIFCYFRSENFFGKSQLQIKEANF